MAWGTHPSSQLDGRFKEKQETGREANYNHSLHFTWGVRFIAIISILTPKLEGEILDN